MSKTDKYSIQSDIWILGMILSQGWVDVIMCVVLFTFVSIRFWKEMQNQD